MLGGVNMERGSGRGLLQRAESSVHASMHSRTRHLDVRASLAPHRSSAPCTRLHWPHTAHRLLKQSLLQNYGSTF